MSTELTPKQLYETRNTDNIFDRQVIVGMLRILNKKLVYEQIWNDTEDGIEHVCVPFFYDFGGSNLNSERFIQDNYTFFTDSECTDIGLKKISGNFDVYPQGRLSMSSISIDAGNITNRFVMARYTKRINGKLKSFVSYLYSMPLTINFNVEIRCDSMNTAFKIDQAYREYFYKNMTFHFNYKGTVCPCRVGFPEQALQPTAGATITMGQAPSENYIKISFSLQCETYQPIFDPHNERPAEQYMRNLVSGINIQRHDNITQYEQDSITWITDFSDMVLTCGQSILLEWKWSVAYRDITQVDISYIDLDDNQEYLIDSIDNNSFYHWDIPVNFIENSTKIDIIIPNTDDCNVYTNPEIFVYPDPNTKIIDETTVYILNKGYFITAQKQVDAFMSYEDKAGNIIDVPIKLNLKNFMIDENNPIDFTCFVYNGIINKKQIKLIIKDHYNKNIMAESDIITIV